MALLIHDLSQEDWDKVKTLYEGWDVVDANSDNHPCVGCFSCWAKTPGECVIKDEFSRMGERIHKADKVTVISRYTYGGFSGAVKNMFDRSLGYVLPQFEISGNETHHKRRYEEDKEFTFIFYGHDLGEEEKNSAVRYVTAVCANVRSHVGAVEFRDTEEKYPRHTERENADETSSKTVFLNGSMRGAEGNSGKIAAKVAGLLNTETETVELRKHLNDLDGLVEEMIDAGTLILCMPLYVDGIPSQMIRLMESFERSYKGSNKKIYLVSNMGLYESSQLVNIFEAVKQWCGRMGFEYCGGLGVSAGELQGVLMQVFPFRVGPTRKIALGAEKLAVAINSGEKTEDIFAEPHLFPRKLFMWIANYSWNVNARNNGISPKDLYRQL